MRSFVSSLAILAWLLPAAASADLQPAKGRLLVATDSVTGDLFNETVILLLHYDETGAMGLVINRPTEIEPKEILADPDLVAGDGGRMFWGGPVRMNTLHILFSIDAPPDGVEAIVESVYYAGTDDDLENLPTDASALRLFIGYAGWAAGQLDYEMARGSWHVVPASRETVFTVKPRTLWEKLRPRRELRAMLPSPAPVGKRVAAPSGSDVDQAPLPDAE